MIGISGTTLFIIPIVMLTCVSFALVHKLFRIDQKRRELRGTHPNSQQSNPRQMEHTNRTLLAILFLFLACEIPAMTMYGSNAILGNEFIENVFHNIGILVDFVQIFGSLINFCLLVSMSQLYRQTLLRVISVSDTRSSEVEMTEERSGQVARSPPTISS